MSDYLDLPRAIAIQVPKPERICFIITPFRGEFQSLSRLIEDAANRLDIRPIRTDKVAQGPDILKQIQDNIRSAKIVVAVCSPVGNDEPNVNVMYELGFARALGKSILLVTTLHQLLPFDLGRFMRLVEYTPAQLADARQSEGLAITLKDAMRTLLDAMDKANNPLTNPGYTDIRVIPSRYAVPDFWVNVQIVVSFAKTIHHEMQTLQHICLDTLEAKAVQVRDNVPETIHAFTSAVTDFHLYWFGATIAQSLSDLLKGVADVEGAMLYLKQQLETLHDEKYMHLCRAHESYARLRPLLQEYDTYRKHLETPSAPTGYLVTTVTELSAKTKFLMTHADNILRDMAVVMAEE